VYCPQIVGLGLVGCQPKKKERLNHAKERN
jgi:hypothetical protein